jgi:hypothetical protein
MICTSKGFTVFLVGAMAALAACTADSSPPPLAAVQAGVAPAHSPVPRTDTARSLLVVHKSPTCGCCVAWVDHMRQAGFVVEVRDHVDMGPVKDRVGVPYAKGSCHTAEIDGYFVEGHVPAEDVRRLLAERPDARGLTVPGMPAGSPGMELPDGTVHPYAVELVHRDGSTSEYARHGH